MTAASKFENKVILITGGSGSFGTYATQRLLNLNPKEIRIYSRKVSKQRILAKKIEYDPTVRFIPGNVKDGEKLVESAKGVNIIIHAAANKYIDLCQEDPQGAIATNVIGTQNVIKAALKNKVNFVVNLSADKAVYPTSVYGATKLLSEELIINSSRQQQRVIFINLRYSNVLGSSGSVVEIFRLKLQQGGTIEVFDPRAERLILTQDDVWKLLEIALEYGKGGETFVYLAPKVKIVDLAYILQKQIGKGKVKIGKNLRPGEKIGAYLISEEEAKRTYLIGAKIAVIIPQTFPDNYHKKFKRFKQDSYQVNNALHVKEAKLSEMLAGI